MHVFSKNSLALAVASSALGITPVFADEEVPQEVIQLEEVIVTGEKIQRSQDRTLSSVAVSTSEDMRKEGAKTLQDVLSGTPGVYTQSGNENWGIRGVPVQGFDEQGAAALNGAISVYVDDAIQSNRLLTANPLSVWDVEQVEVYRGAQSTTQGRNSLAGAVVMKTKDPTFTPEFAVQGNLGRYGEQGSSALANGALVQDRLAGRLAVDYQTEDGYINNQTLGEDANPLRTANVRGKLLFLPSDDVDVLLTFSHNDQRAGLNGVQANGGVPDYFNVYNNTETYHKFDQNAMTGKLDWYLDDEWTLTSISSATFVDYNGVLDFDEGPTTLQAATRHHEQTLASQEVRLGYDYENLTGFFGAYAGRTSGKIDDKLIQAGTVLVSQQGKVEIDSYALFGEANWEFVDDWTLITGLRWDHEENHTRMDYPIDVPASAADPSADENISSSVLLPKLGLSYDVTENHLVGLTWQRGYRSGGVNLRSRALHTPYDPEFTDTYELAWRGNWLNRRLRTNANVYYTDWTDQQVTFLDASNNRQVANAADSRMAGAELSAQYLVTSQLSVHAGASYSDTKYNSFVSDGVDYSGHEFLFAPKYQASVGANYTFDNGLMIGTNVVYQDDSISNFIPGGSSVVGERRSDAVTLVNLNAEYAVGSMTFTGYVKNLFNERYVTNNQKDTVVDVGAPLTFGVAARYEF
ncbi:TonB-dependent receptor [Thalassospira xiamenensis]|uniref:Outer membrane receptor proteins, mostly Fe transport n=1 Tax=Thalassospira xiamenensis TaxID=220697 RepID=A0A285U0Z7_9PROT|nr:TonB-dependent receptor [Thalassospira xiamenensis]SOC29972.1 Outer membrane receptor proteins, mostly Fe transport [Thalassospira xiamenensis]